MQSYPIITQQIKEHHISIDPKRMSESEGAFLYHLFLALPAHMIALWKDSIRIGNDIYHLTMKFPILITRDFNNINNVVRLEVVEVIDPNVYYKNDINTNKINLNFSFLQIINHLGVLVATPNNQLIYQGNQQPFVIIKCLDMIDPLTASLAHQIFLNDMLESIYHDQKFKENQQDTISTIENGYLVAGLHSFKLMSKKGYVIIDVLLKSSIALRESARYPGQYHADVVGKYLGSGSYAIVVSILGTVKNLAFNWNPHRVLKDFAVSDAKRHSNNAENQRYVTSATVLCDVELGSSTEHLGTKKPTRIIRNGEEHWQIRENLLPGEDLFEIISKFKIKTNQYPKSANDITVDEFLELLYESSLALLQQFHFKKIVNKDVKPDNMRVDRANHMRCYIFDTDLAKRIDVNDEGKSSGTPGYMSPEAAYGQRTSHASDVFGLMRALIYFLGDNQPGDDQAFSANNYVPKYPNLNILVKNNMLDIKHAGKIKEIFTLAFEFDPAQRCNIEFIIHQVDKIIWERILEKAKKVLPDFMLANFILAHDSALSIRSRLMTFTKKLNDAGQDVYTPKWISDVKAAELQDLQNYIINNLSKLINDPFIISEFCRTSGIRAIRDMRRKQDIEKCVSGIINSYLQHSSQLNKLHSESDEHKRVFIEKTLHLRKKYSYNLDNIKLLADKFAHAVKKVNLVPPVKRSDSGLLKQMILFRPESLSLPPRIPSKLANRRPM